MLRSMTGLLALTLLVAASPAHRQPTSNSVPPLPASSTSEPTVARKSPEDMEKDRKATEARDRAWDTKMKSSMDSVCKGC
jgi:hypothetical protein